MPLTRPTLPEIIERVSSDLEARLPGTDARLRRSNLGVMARVEAGAVHGLYGFGEYIAKQTIIDTAEAEYLERWAAIYDVGRKPAAAAAGTVVCTGTNGVVVPAGTVIQRADGQQFVTQADGAIAAGSVTVPVRASVAGVAGNTTANTRLTLAATILGVSAEARVSTDGIGSGADIESDDDLRTRLLRRIQKKPQGGADYDYEDWATEVPGVTRAWVRPRWMGAGTVGLLFVRDNDADFIPNAAAIAAVNAYVQPKIPVTAELYVLAPTPLAINFQLSVTPNTEAVKAAVEAELRDLFLREAEPGATLPLTHIDEAISLAEGETDHNLVQPTASIVPAAHQIPVLGAVTWV